MRALLMGMLALAGTVSAAATPGAPITDNYSFALASNSSWTGAHASPIASSNKISVGSKPGEPFGFVWAPACSAGRQTVTFSRKVDIPGPPSKANFSWVLVERGGGGIQLDSIQLRVNGRTVYVGKGYGSNADLDARALKAFNFGVTTLTVQAVRASLGPREAKAGCNHGPAPSFAIGFSLTGELSADLAARETGSPETIVTYNKASTTMRYVLHLSIRNNGPSGVVTAQVNGGLGGNEGGFPVLHATATPRQGLGTCTTGRGSFECKFSNIPPNAVLKDAIVFEIVISVPSPNFGEFVLGLGYGVKRTDGGREGDTSNNSFQFAEVICGNLATSSACASAGTA